MRGGLLEIAVFAVLSNQTVAVYLWEEKIRLYVLWLCMNRKEGVVGERCVLYNGRDHFDELVGEWNRM